MDKVSCRRIRESPWCRTQITIHLPIRGIPTQGLLVLLLLQTSPSKKKSTINCCLSRKLPVKLLHRSITKLREAGSHNCLRAASPKCSNKGLKASIIEKRRVPSLVTVGLAGLKRKRLTRNWATRCKRAKEMSTQGQRAMKEEWTTLRSPRDLHLGNQLSYREYPSPMSLCPSTTTMETSFICPSIGSQSGCCSRNMIDSLSSKTRRWQEKTQETIV